MGEGVWTLLADRSGRGPREAGGGPPSGPAPSACSAGGPSSDRAGGGPGLARVACELPSRVAGTLRVALWARRAPAHRAQAGGSSLFL